MSTRFVYAAYAQGYDMEKFEKWQKGSITGAVRLHLMKYLKTHEPQKSEALKRGQFKINVQPWGRRLLNNPSIPSSETLS